MSYRLLSLLPEIQNKQTKIKKIKNKILKNSTRNLGKSPDDEKLAIQKFFHFLVIY